MPVTKRYEAWITCDECGMETHPENDVTMPLVVAEAKRVAEAGGWYVTQRRAFCPRCYNNLEHTKGSRA